MNGQRSDPSALRFLIGHELRVAREQAGKRQSDAAKVLSCSQAKINYLETGKTQQQPDQVRKLLESFGSTVDQVDRMTSLAARADQGTWWASFSDVLPDWFKIFVGLEGLARSAFTYAALVLPGQLQTPRYMGALLEGNLRVPPMEAQQVVHARMARQRIATDAHPLTFRAVIEEYVLQRVVGGPEVMREQLKHVLEMGARENVELQVMPVSTTVHDGLDGDFLLLNFAEANGVGYIEYPAGAIYVQDQEQVAAYHLSAERLQNVALTAEESRALIEERIKELGA